jgi:hypothetical protein
MKPTHPRLPSHRKCLITSSAFRLTRTAARRAIEAPRQDVGFKNVDSCFLQIDVKMLPNILVCFPYSAAGQILENFVVMELRKQSA